MRTLKFQTWTGDQMIAWGFIDGAFRGPPSGNANGGYNPLTTPHLQFTGLQDMKGVDIYEGNICRSLRCGLFTIAFKGACFVATNGWVNFRPDLWNEQLEVVGNRYQHPELLDELLEAKP